MKSFFTRVFKQFFFLFGILAFLIWFFLRFVRERPSGNIDLTFSLLKILSYAFSITVAIIAILLLLNNIFSIISVENKEKSKIVEFFIKTAEKVENVRKEFLNMCFEKIMLRIPKYQAVFDFFKGILWYTRHYYRLIVSIFIILPRFIASLSFFIDVAIYRNFHYFPKLVILLLIPFLLRCILWYMNKHCDDFCNLVTFCIDKKEEADGTSTYSIYPEALKNEMHANAAIYIMNNLQYFLDKYDLYRGLQRLLEEVNTLWPEKVVFQIISSIFWIISWIYLIIYML